MTLLLRLWPYLAGAALFIGGAAYLNHRGYAAGYAASEAKWQPLWKAADIARAEANARAATQEAQSKILTAAREKEYDEVVASIALRADAADGRVRDLMRQLSTTHPGGCQLPQTGGTPANPDAASSFNERSERAGSDLVALARRCEEDAAALTSLQKWIREQLALFQPSP